MIPLNPWEHQNSIKTLYASCVGEICTKHDISRMELDILLFLANNPRFDTATDIVKIRYLSKSQVSSSIKLLEQRGYLKKEYTDHNRKTAHLRICEPAANIVSDGKSAQEKFLSIMLKGFSQMEINSIQQYNARIWHNIHTYLKEETE